jgi:hypothetical protein
MERENNEKIREIEEEKKERSRPLSHTLFFNNPFVDKKIIKYVDIRKLPSVIWFVVFVVYFLLSSAEEKEVDDN